MYANEKNVSLANRPTGSLYRKPSSFVVEPKEQRQHHCCFRKKPQKRRIDRHTILFFTMIRLSDVDFLQSRQYSSLDKLMLDGLT